MRRTRLALAALAGAAALAGTPAGAIAAPGWTGTAAVPSSPSATHPAVALDADGTATALWQQNVGEAVLKTATKPAGGAWSQPTALTGGFSSHPRPQLAVAADGSATAVWRNDTRIETASRDADGTWSSVAPLSIDGDLPTGSPEVAIDLNGTVTAAWGQGCAVIVSTRPARSDTWSSPRAIFTVPDGCSVGTAGYGQVSNKVALGSDRTGNVTAVWRAGTNSLGSVRSIKSSVRTGGPRGGWSEPQLIAEPPGRATPNVLGVELLVDVDGRAVATWPVDGAGAAAATRPAGTDAAWDSNPQPLPSTATATPSALLDAHGRASVAWNVAQDGPTPPAVKLATVSAAGAWSTTETAATLPDSSPATAPQLALDDDGGATVVWTRTDVGGAFVEAARRPAGGAWTPIAPVTSAAVAAAGASVGLAGDALGNVTAVWPAGADAADPNSITAVDSADFNAEPALRTDWSGRADPTSNSLHSWVRYLYTPWPSAIPGVPDGPGFVELTDGATWPDPADRYSWRWGQHDAWRDVTNGELVIEQQGTLRFAMPSHGIDIRLVNPELRVAADGRAARLISDGTTGGSMEDARQGRVSTRPFEDLHVLDIDLAAGGHRAGAAVGRRSWIAAPATMTSVAGTTLGVTYAGAPFGKLTFSAPVVVEDREPRREDERRPPVDEPRQPVVDPPRPPIVDPPRPPVLDPPKPKDPAPRAIAITVPARGVVRIGRANAATVATFTCPRGTCTVRVPRRVAITIGRGRGSRHWIDVLAPRTVRAGRRARVRLRWSGRTASLLFGISVGVKFTIFVDDGDATTRKRVNLVLAGRASGRSGARGRSGRSGSGKRAAGRRAGARR